MSEFGLRTGTDGFKTGFYKGTLRAQNGMIVHSRNFLVLFKPYLVPLRKYYNCFEKLQRQYFCLTIIYSDIVTNRYALCRPLSTKDFRNLYC